MKRETSQEEIINKAIKFQLEGNISEAAKYYQFCLNSGFVDHRVFSNYGLILRSLGKLKEAEILIKKAIQLKPDFVNNYNNLGIILRDLKKLEEAETIQRKAIELRPDIAEIHCNLGNIFADLGNLQDAEISIRTAIELKPDLVEAHYSLGTILTDLGKLQDTISLSKSTLDLKSITPGDRLIASLRITIACLLQEDFSGTLFYLNKTNKLINQGAVSSIKNEKTKSHTLTFSRFISALSSQFDKNDSSTKKIPHFGDSHCLSFAHQILSLSSQKKKIQPVLITGAKAWHFANNKNNRWKDSLTQQMKNYTDTEDVFISFGEIDCRKDQGILSFSMKKNKKISDVCNETVKSFINYMEITLSSNYAKRYYFGIPAPTINKNTKDKLDKKRIEIIKIYNSILKQEVLARGCFFVDVYSLTSNENGENNNIYMCDDFHLSPKGLSILFKNSLHKP